MVIAPQTVVALEYTLRDDDGQIIDSSDGEPLEYLHGHGELIAGVESALDGHKVGDHLDVTVAPEDGYGIYDPTRIIDIERDELPDDIVPEIGMELSTDGPDGEPITMWIIEINDAGLRLDANHPLAGQTLHFTIDVHKIRAASATEQQSGQLAHTKV